MKQNAPYYFSPDGKQVTFTFCNRDFGLRRARKVYLIGSFNEWKHVPDPFWEFLETPAAAGTRELTLPADSLHKPGNSGYPEFKYMIFNRQGKFIELVPPVADTSDSGMLYHFLNNLLLFFPGEDPASALAEARAAERVFTLDHFDLESAIDRKKIANFRLVPGTRNLYRSYHPYKKSFIAFDTEEARSRLVKELMIEHAVRSVICLSGEEDPNPALAEEISSRHAEIIQSGNELFIDTSYEAAYYHTGENDFLAVMAEIVHFIATHPAPYQVHCRLGSDRTGVVSAFLAGLCGATWAEITADYISTREMGIREFRNPRLLAWAISHFTTEPLQPEHTVTLELRAALLDSGLVTPELVDKAIYNLVSER